MVSNNAIIEQAKYSERHLGHSKSRTPVQAGNTIRGDPGYTQTWKTLAYSRNTYCTSRVEDMSRRTRIRHIVVDTAVSIPFINCRSSASEVGSEVGSGGWSNLNVRIAIVFAGKMEELGVVDEDEGFLLTGGDSAASTFGHRPGCWPQGVIYACSLELSK